MLAGETLAVDNVERDALGRGEGPPTLFVRGEDGLIWSKPLPEALSKDPRVLAANRSLELFAPGPAPAFQCSWTTPVSSMERVQRIRNARIAGPRVPTDAAHAAYDANAPQKAH